MNKRIAKKNIKKASEVMKTSRKTGIGVAIINQITVDKNGQPCDAMESGSRLIRLKRPRIQYVNQQYSKESGEITHANSR